MTWQEWKWFAVVEYKESGNAENHNWSSFEIWLCFSLSTVNNKLFFIKGHDSFEQIPLYSNQKPLFKISFFAESVAVWLPSMRIALIKHTVNLLFAFPKIGPHPKLSPPPHKNSSDKLVRISRSLIIWQVSNPAPTTTIILQQSIFLTLLFLFQFQWRNKKRKHVQEHRNTKICVQFLASYGSTQTVQTSRWNLRKKCTYLRWERMDGKYVTHSSLSCTVTYGNTCRKIFK